MNRTVVVTGMAWNTALGTTLTGVWHRLIAGESGLRPVGSPYPVRNLLAATVEVPDPRLGPARRQLALAVGTVHRALADAGLSAARGDAALVLGTSYGAHFDDGGAGSLHSWATETAARSGFRQPPVSLSTACSSGADAIATGGHLIEAGATEVCVCAGVDILTDVKRLGHTALRTMSPTLLRAFDPRRDGTLLGEGAGSVVLEAAEHARQRGTGGYAVLRGAGSSNDAAGMTAPDLSGAGVVLAVRRSLEAAGIAPDSVTVINAHGSGTPANDTAEAVGLAELFPSGGPVPTVFATKGAFGHTLGATGAIEAIAVVLALRYRQVPPVYGVAADTAPTLPLPVAVGGPTRIRDGAGISLTLGFGGFNTSLVFEDASGVLA